MTRTNEYDELHSESIKSLNLPEMQPASPVGYWFYHPQAHTLGCLGRAQYGWASLAPSSGSYVSNIGRTYVSAYRER